MTPASRSYSTFTRCTPAARAPTPVVRWLPENGSKFVSVVGSRFWVTRDWRIIFAVRFRFFSVYICRLGSHLLMPRSGAVLSLSFHTEVSFISLSSVGCSYFVGFASRAAVSGDFDLDFSGFSSWSFSVLICKFGDFRSGFLGAFFWWFSTCIFWGLFIWF